ncbi:MAG: hypothetical protein HY862_17805 [Chloroflexi bacterium]|nr:hypothetical protein [Chloroflexota bacterium]
MRNYLFTGIITIALGLGLGLYIGWVQYPVEYRNSYMCQLSDQYQEDYTLMVARGYREDGDLNKALDRLQPLRAVGIAECDDGRSYQIDNIPEWVQVLTERYISQGADPSLIRDLVALAEGFGRLTPIMESFRS